jgi:hypothetical protein
MSSLYTQFKSDSNLEKTGILLQYGINDRVKAALIESGKTEAQAESGAAIAIRIARAGGANTQFQKRMEILVKPYRRQLQTETHDTKVIDRLVRQVYAETVVLGWENVDNAAGQPLSHSVDACMQLFIDLPDLFADLQEQAQRAALFRAEILEVEAGN